MAETVRAVPPPPGRVAWPKAATWDHAWWAAWLRGKGWDDPAILRYLNDRDRLTTSVTTGVGKSAKRIVLYAPGPRAVAFHDATQPNLLYGGAAGGMKALALDTVVPTPSGARTVADLRVGDTVFDEHGQPVPILAVTPVDFDPCGTYRVTFDDGTSVVCGGAHEWTTWTYGERAARVKATAAWREQRRLRRPPRGAGKRVLTYTTHKPTTDVPGTPRTTREIAATLHARREHTNHAVAVAGAWVLPETALPLDPYVLGVWLGDGTAVTGVITSADQGVLDACAAAGFPSHHVPSSRYGYRLAGLHVALKAMGLLGNKHIPEAYFVGSESQRLALLQGLMDTDGTALQTGRVVFTNTNERLVRGVVRLAASLGIKPFVQSYQPTLKGHTCAPAWRVTWTSHRVVFRLARKQKQGHSRRQTQRYRYIVAVEPMPDLPVKCVTVDSPTHQFLITDAAIPTHNSYTARWDAYKRLLAVPGTQALLLRRNYTELIDNHINDASKECERMKDAGIPIRYLKDDRRIVVERKGEDPSWLRFGHCQNEGDEEQYLSSNYEVVYLDEAATFTQKQAMAVQSRLRSVLVDQPFFRCMSNPGGAQTLWLKRYFIDRTVSEEEHEDYTPDEWGFIFSQLYDNPYLMDPDGTWTKYARRLKGYGPERARQMLDGDWDAIAGQFFGEFRREHHVQNLGDPGDEVQWIRGMDWGYNQPGVCYWVACLPDGRLYFRYEYWFRQTLVADVAREIAKRTEQFGIKHVRYTTADGHMFDKTGTGESMAETMARHGVPLLRADNSKGARKQGWQRLRHWLATAPDGKPWMVLHPKCEYLARTLPALVSDDDDPEDVDTHGDDHGGDAARYIVMSRPSPTRIDPGSAPQTPGTWGWWRQWHARQERRSGVLA